MNRLYRLATASMIAITVAVSLRPASAQLVVFDPNNYAQNVLTAARSLQQINNQIVSLQNQAQMLVNQAKNLATLPFSSLLQLEQSIQRTQQLLAQAQRIAYDVGQIDRAFSTTYAPHTPKPAPTRSAPSRWTTRPGPGSGGPIPERASAATSTATADSIRTSSS